MEASFSLSYELLTRSCKGCGVCSPSFPPTLIWPVRRQCGRWKQIPAEDALGELVKWSLVDYLPPASGEGGRYTSAQDLARVFAGIAPGPRLGSRLKVGRAARGALTGACFLLADELFTARRGEGLWPAFSSPGSGVGEHPCWASLGPRENLRDQFCGSRAVQRLLPRRASYVLGSAPPPHG